MAGRVEGSGLLNQPAEYVSVGALVVLLLIVAAMLVAVFRRRTARRPGDIPRALPQRRQKQVRDAVGIRDQDEELTPSPTELRRRTGT